MVNPTTAAFRKMMLNGRLNTLMNQSVQEGIAATASAREDIQTMTNSPRLHPKSTVKEESSMSDASAEETHKDIEQCRRLVRPAFFTPMDKPSRKQPTQAELDAEFAIPSHVLKKKNAPDR